MCVSVRVSVSLLYNKQCLLLARFCVFYLLSSQFGCWFCCCRYVWVHQHNGNIQSESINEAVCSVFTFNHMFPIHFCAHTHTKSSRHFFALSCFLLNYLLLLLLKLRKFSRTRNSRNICYFGHFDDLYILAMYTYVCTYVCVCHK